MLKKVFNYTKIAEDVWYTKSLKGWFIVKENEKYYLRKGSFDNSNQIVFSIKRFNSYKRLGDAKTGLERLLKDRVKAIKQQEELFNELQKLNKKDNEIKELDYEFLNKEAERLKKKWGLC